MNKVTRDFAPDWVSRGIGIDFEFMKNTYLLSPKIDFSLPDNKKGKDSLIKNICIKEIRKP